MGFRYRKSINLGAGFRINFSKSGVGYSFGGKGFRYTRTARGTDRVTFSVPGTGISWTQESGKPQSPKNVDGSAPNTEADTEQFLCSIENEDIDGVTSGTKETFIRAVKKFIFVDKALTFIAFSVPIAFMLYVIFYTLSDFSRFAAWIPAVLILLFPFVITVKIIHRLTGRIPVTYEYDESGEKEKERLRLAIECLSGCSFIWQITDIYTNNNRRVCAGTSSSVDRTRIKIKKKKPYFLVSNENSYYIKLKKEKAYILPDMILLISGKKVGAVGFSDLRVNFGTMPFVEEAAVPNDAKVIRKTWKYVNNNGTPDRRFKGNRQLPVCLYAVMNIFTDTGVNLQFHLSDEEKANRLRDILTQKDGFRSESFQPDEPNKGQAASLDENSKSIIDGLQLWANQVRAFHNASTTDEFFEKYDELCRYATTLLHNEKRCMEASGIETFDKSTREMLQTVKSSDTLESELINFIEKSFKVCFNRILPIKTKKARNRHVSQWFDSFQPYQNRLSYSAEEKLKERHEKLLLECDKGT